MFNTKYLTKTIKDYIDNQENQFVIFPYGDNGLHIESVLKKYFDMEPIYIVDNEYCKYSKRVISLQELKANYNEDMLVILTIENEKLNSMLYKELRTVVPESRIINLLNQIKKESTVSNVVKRQFELSSFLPVQGVEKEMQSLLPRKIKVRIVHSSITVWNVIASICRAFQEEPQFEVLIIVGDSNNEKMIDQVQSGYVYCTRQEYDVVSDRPDIMVFMPPFINHFERASLYRKNAKMIVAATMSLISYSTKNIEEFKNLCLKGIEQLYPDYWLFDSLLYQWLRDSNVFDGEIIEIGNAKFDEIYEACRERKFPAEWEKLRRKKKVVLWSTDHGLAKGIISRDLTFDLYAKTMFAYAREHNDIGFIFRPHSTFVSELLRNFYWSVEDLEELKNYFSATDNMVWDEFDTYANAYSAADVILTDGFCGMICSALPTLKPIGVTYRQRSDDGYYPELTDNYYKIFCEQDLKEFLNMAVIDDKDPKYLKRKAASEKYIMHYDGKNGERIKNFIKERFFAMYGE